MLISIITPTFNSEKTIEKNVKSIINQTYKNFEHIIIDNLSKDNTIDIINKIYKENNLIESLHIISEPDRGIADAFNKGIEKAKGEIIGILNSDDRYFNNNVFQKVNHSFKDKEIIFVHGDVYFDDPVYGSNIRRPLLCPITTTMPYNHPTMFFRKDVYEKYGSYNESYKYTMDYELIMRYEKKIPDFRNKGKYLKGEPIAVMHSGGASWKYEMESIKEYKNALKKYDFWDFNARKEYFLRIFRTRLKKIFNDLHLNFLVKLWRKNKWGN
ncbi:MAG: glycosyltransferase family 2 protein [Ignavibacteriaceae bacterium]